MERVQSFTIMEDFMKANLKMIINKDMDMNFIRTIQYIEETLRKEKEKGKADFNGQMVKYMMGNGKIILNMEVVCGKIKILQPAIQVNGDLEQFQVLEFLPIRKVNDMRESLLTLINKDMEHIDFKMEIDQSVFLEEISQMVNVNIFGRMVIIIKEIFPMDFDMEKASSNMLMVAILKASSEMIKSAGQADKSILMTWYIWGTIKMTSDMDLVN